MSCWRWYIVRSLACFEHLWLHSLNVLNVLWTWNVRSKKMLPRHLIMEELYIVFFASFAHTLKHHWAHCVPVTSYGIRDTGQPLWKYVTDAWCQQVITCTSVKLCKWIHNEYTPELEPYVNHHGISLVMFKSVIKFPCISRLNIHLLVLCISAYKHTEAIITAIHRDANMIRPYQSIQLNPRQRSNTDILR